MFERHLSMAVKKLHRFYGCRGIEDFAYFFRKTGFTDKAEVVEDCHQAMH
jgi:hypothetical protein